MGYEFRMKTGFFETKMVIQRQVALQVSLTVRSLTQGNATRAEAVTVIGKALHLK